MLKIELKDNKITVADNEQVTVLPKTLEEYMNGKADSRGKHWISLPANSLNRQWVCVEKLLAKGIVEYAEPNNRSDISSQAIGNPLRKTSKGWVDYLTDEERKTIDDIRAKCEARMNDPLTKLLKEKERLDAMIAKLQAEKEANNK